jgi:hypothetical protein
VLEGGVNASIGLDGHGKSLSFLVLDMSVEIPADVPRRARATETIAPGRSS